MTNKVAFIFPGQGSQCVGMGKDLYENNQHSRRIFDKANEILNTDIKKMCFEGPENELKQTINTQPAIVTTSIATLEALKSLTNIEPYVVAGHSLGEYSAMYSANVLDLEQTLIAIQKRAMLMNEINKGSMAAVINCSEETLQKGLEHGRKFGYVDIANYNSPIQVVLTGDTDAVNETGEYIKSKEICRVIPLAVSGAFHSEYLKDSAKIFDDFLKNIDIKDAKIPVITNVDAQKTISKTDFRHKMPTQMYSPVHWDKTIKEMLSDGVDTFVEIGCGRVLTGLNKKNAPNAKTYNVYDKETLDIFVRENNN